MGWCQHGGTIFTCIFDNNCFVLDKSNLNFFSKQHYHENRCIAILPSICLTLILFAGLFATILTSTSFPSAAYSLSDSTINVSKADSANKSLATPFKEIPEEVREFILNDIVNKSKAAIVIGFIDPDGTKVYRLWKCLKG